MEFSGVLYNGISIHALREEGDLCLSETCETFPVFLSTPSARRATRQHVGPAALRRDFYPRPPRGGRREPESRFCCCRKFLSTPSARRATRPRASSSTSRRFLSTPSARRATWICARTPVRGSGFLSTPSARRATDVRVTSVEKITYFYPRPPRGGRPQDYDALPTLSTISIHALREEGDPENTTF